MVNINDFKFGMYFKTEAATGLSGPNSWQGIIIIVITILNCRFMQHKQWQ
jgi:hypothetical protein